MIDQTDKTKDLLKNILSNLYRQEAETASQHRGESYLMGQDGQYLGKITPNHYHINSILNKYGPYGSKYSTTSIFNQYSNYGSIYGNYSLNNQYSTLPPKLMVNGRFKIYVSKNEFVSPRISPEVFFYNLNNNIDGLEKGEIINTELDLRISNRESFLLADDNLYLGSLNPNEYDDNSIFNQFGSFGNKYSPTSIYNPYSPYGGQFGEFSPFNPYSNHPPHIYLRGEEVGFLTKNFTLLPRVEPDKIKEWVNENAIPFS